LMLYSFSNAVTYTVYEVRVVESRLLYCKRRKPSNSVLLFSMGTYGVLYNCKVGRLPTHGKRLLNFITGLFSYFFSYGGWLPDESEMVMEIERGSTRSHVVETWLWKGLCICRKTVYSCHF
jgi:hypothetical protein